MGLGIVKGSGVPIQSRVGVLGKLLTSCCPTLFSMWNLQSDWLFQLVTLISLADQIICVG